MICLGLLILPFLWLGENASLGGDDSRLYFVYPLEWLREYALPAFGSLTGFGTYSEQQQYLAFIAILGGIEALFPSLNLEAFAFGCTLLSGFIGVYSTALLMMPKTAAAHRYMVASLAGIMFVSAPIAVTMYWVGPLAWLVGVGGAPLLIALAATYLTTGRSVWLLPLAVLSPIYAAGLATLPISLPFLFGAIALGGMVLLVIPRPAPPLRRIPPLAAVLLGCNAFWMLPLVISAITPGAFANEALSAGSDLGSLIRGVSKGQSILDTFLLLPSGTFLKAWGWASYGLWDWSGTRLLLLLSLPVLVAAACLLLRRCEQARGQIFFALIAVTLAFAYCQTVNLTSIGVDTFVGLSTTIPGLKMFRNFYNKFTGAYVFYYAIMFAVALSVVLSRMRRIPRLCLLSLMTAIIVIQGTPLLTGASLFVPITPGQRGGPAYTPVGRFPKRTLDAMRYLATTEGTGRVLELPLSANYWSVLPLSVPDAFYVGSSPVPILAGMQAFNSPDSFASTQLPQLEERLRQAIVSRDLPTLDTIIRLTGINYLLYTGGIPSDVAQHWLFKPLFPANDGGMENIARSVGARRMAAFSDAGGTTQVYAIPAKSTLPRLFVAGNSGEFRSVDSVIGGVLDERQVSASGQTDRTGTASPVAGLAASQRGAGSIIADRPDTGALEHVEHAVAWRYTASVDVRRPSLLVLLEPSTSDWTAGMRDANGNTHPLQKVTVNGYASGWRLSDLGRYSVTIEYAPQRYTWIAASISALTILLSALFIAAERFRNSNRKKRRSPPEHSNLLRSWWEKW